MILRPSAVYGPRDTDFLLLFKALQRHVFPSFGGGGHQPGPCQRPGRSRVACLTHPAAAGRTYNVASPEALTVRELAGEIARQMKVWTLPLPLPLSFLWPACLAQEGALTSDRAAQHFELPKDGELRALAGCAIRRGCATNWGLVAATRASGRDRRNARLGTRREHWL